MKILQLGTSLTHWGGIERYIKILSVGLRESGMSVRVACPPGSPLEKHVASETAPIQLRFKWDWRVYLALRQEMRVNQPDIVHIHYSPEFFMGALAAKSLRCKVVLTRHVALPWPRPKANIYDRLFDHIIPVSEAVQRQLVLSGISPNKMTVAKAGNDALVPTIARDTMRHQLQIASDVLQVGSFGRLANEKGVDVAIDAIKKSTRVHLNVFGAGPAEASLRAQAQGLSVTFHGVLEDVANEMSAMDVVVIPSIWEEAFPYAALESLSLGIPVIASNIGGLPEVISDRHNGRLFVPGDSDSLARVFSELVADPNQIKPMGERGRALHASTYTVEKMVERISAVYRSIV